MFRKVLIKYGFSEETLENGKSDLPKWPTYYLVVLFFELQESDEDFIFQKN